MFLLSKKGGSIREYVGMCMYVCTHIKKIQIPHTHTQTNIYIYIYIYIYSNTLVNMTVEFYMKHLFIVKI